MLWNLEKLEQERLDLIEVISALRRVERLSQTDRTSVFEEITAHMGRLSELDAEKLRIQCALEAYRRRLSMAKTHRCSQTPSQSAGGTPSHS